MQKLRREAVSEKIQYCRIFLGPDTESVTMAVQRRSGRQWQADKNIWCLVRQWQLSEN